MKTLESRMRQLEQQTERRREMNTTEGQDGRAMVQKQMVVAVIVEFYGFKHNPWTLEQALEAMRRRPERRRFLRNPRELKEDTEAKMWDARMEF